MVRKTAAEKAAELAAAKAKKEADTEAKKAKKAAPKTVAVKAAAVPKAAVKTVAVKAAPAAAPAAVGVKPGPKKKAAEPEWACPADGNVYPWTYKGTNYLRNSENQVWLAEADGGCGDWAGLYLKAEDRIDDSAADPYADDE